MGFYIEKLLYFLITRNPLFYSFFQFESSHLGILSVLCQHLKAAYCFSLPAAGVGFRDTVLHCKSCTPCVPKGTWFQNQTQDLGRKQTKKQRNKENSPQSLCMSSKEMNFFPDPFFCVCASWTYGTDE